jgi:hypothetical protein
MQIKILALIIVCLFFTNSCGYQLVRGDIASDLRFAVPTASNASEFVGIEAELTQSTRQQLHSMIGAQLNSRSSDYALNLSITKARRAARVWSRSGGANMGTIALTVNYKLVSIHDGSSVLDQSVSRNQEFLFSNNENTNHAFSEAIADIAQQIVLEIAEHLTTIN